MLGAYGLCHPMLLAADTSTSTPACCEKSVGEEIPRSEVKEHAASVEAAKEREVVAWRKFDVFSQVTEGDRR